MNSYDDDFINVTTNPLSTHALGPQPTGYNVSQDYFAHSSGQRAFTETAIVASILTHYPHHHLTVSGSYIVDLLTFANSRDDASYTVHGDGITSLVERQFIAPTRRYGDDNIGAFADAVQFACYDFSFKGNHFLVYIVEGDYSMMAKKRVTYILVAPSKAGRQMTSEEKVQAQLKSDELIQEATKWSLELHKEVLIFDSGFWQKNKELWENVQKSNWEDVILEEKKKKALVKDVLGFFESEEKYKSFGVAWKRGIILYGPPGNGKTISTKALMHDVSRRLKPTIESLYVKSFRAVGGPERGIRSIFLKARQMAPCLLIFEDIDSLVDVSVRSYFLNEVDGLESNHGILMIGSTNHLERLDPGIAKRPSRFDRKYFFGDPDWDERRQYAGYWRGKLSGNKEVRFPEVLQEKVADVTEGFSFAYLKEAFVASLLVIVGRSVSGVEEEEEGRNEGGGDEDDDGLKDNILWLELKKQIESLRKEMDDESQSQGQERPGLDISSLTIGDTLNKRAQATEKRHDGNGGSPWAWDQNLTDLGHLLLMEDTSNQQVQTMENRHEGGNGGSPWVWN